MRILEKYDLVIIGGGPAGTPVAIEYAKLNKDKNIALIDSLGKLGGECLFQGCIPSKIMESSTKHIKLLGELQEFGIKLEDKHYNLIWDKIKQNKSEILSKRSNAAANIVESLPNIDLIDATATFESKDTIRLDFNDKTSKLIDFKKAVIATGSRSFIPRYDGDGVSEILTNSDFFAKMELPDSLSIIGSGAIAIEFSQILATLGVKINLFVRGDKILKNIDKEASKFLFEVLNKDTNINLILNSDIQRVDKEEDELKITYIQDNQIKTIKSKKVLSAAGRVANIDNLKLENVDVKYTNHGIIANKHLATSNQNIYANGDVVDGFPKFAHTAQYGAHTIAQNLFLEHNLFSIDYDKNSWVLFSMPNIAQAGISEEEAQNRGLDIIVDKFDFSTEAKSQINKDDYGYLKFIVEKSSNKIIGVSMLHNEAHSLGGEASLIVANKLKLKDIIDSIHPHPTISESYVMLAKKMMGEIMLEKLEKPIVKSLLSIERWL